MSEPARAEDPPRREDGPPGRDECDYAAFYCEENIQRLLALPWFARREAWALILSNDGRSVALRSQRAGIGPESSIVWDYHVVALASGKAEPGPDRWLVFDFDTWLGFPVPATSWLEGTLRVTDPPSLMPLFRLLSAPAYVAQLASDRSHMIRSDGSWSAPPPPWPAPGAGRANNLMEWIDMSRPRPGSVLDLAGVDSFVGDPDDRAGPGDA
jgi:hypothetical protein